MQKMKKKILKTIREHNLITEGMHIVLGLSGGPDSVCLFSVLTELAGEMNLTLHPVHINHRFRPGAAEEDQAYVEELCRSNGLSCRSFVYDCPAMAREQKLTPEEAGRKARYEAFFKVAGEIHASGVPASKIAVAVAQNANDQCETILFRILRGTGTDGLSGIAYKRKGQGGFHVIRPLLDITRDEIEKYCADRNLNPRIDHTNSETVYTRNRIRLELIPYLADNFNSNIVETVNRLGRIAAEDRDYIYGQAAAIFDKIRLPQQPDKREAAGGQPAGTQPAGAEPAGAEPAETEVVSVFTAPLENLHPAIRFRVYNIALGKAGMADDVTRAHLEAVEKVRISRSPSASCSLAGGFEVYKAYDRLVFRRGGSEKTASEDSWKLTVMNRQEYCKFMEESQRSQEHQGTEGSQHTSHLYGAFSGKALGPGAKPELRTRRDGDVIAIKGGTKKLSDFFTDCKVPRMYRDEMLLLAVGNRILWVLPSEHFPDGINRQKGRFSAEFRADPVSDETIIVLEQKQFL